MESRSNLAADLPIVYRAALDAVDGLSQLGLRREASEAARRGDPGLQPGLGRELPEALSSRRSRAEAVASERGRGDANRPAAAAGRLTA